LRPQAVIDVADRELEALAATQDQQQPQSRDRVGPARTGDQQASELARAGQRRADRPERGGDRRGPRRCLGVEHPGSLSRRCRRRPSRARDETAVPDYPDPVTTPDISRGDRLALDFEEVQLVVDDPLTLETRDDAAELIAALPVQSFVAVARKLREEQRLELLLPYASAEQITGIFDLDA